MGIGLGLLVLGFHWTERILPAIGNNLHEFEAQMSFPYAIAIVGLILSYRDASRANQKYAEFLRHSPGA